MWLEATVKYSLTTASDGRVAGKAIAASIILSTKIK
jgi:hypothetical protein